MITSLCGSHWIGRNSWEDCPASIQRQRTDLSLDIPFLQGTSKGPFLPISNPSVKCMTSLSKSPLGPINTLGRGYCHWIQGYWSIPWNICTDRSYFHRR